MASTFTENDLRILGYTDVTKLDSIDPNQNPPLFEVFDATMIGGLEKIESRFIYLKSRCGVEIATAAVKSHSHPKNTTYVIKPASSDLSERVVGPDQKLHKHEDLVWTALNNTIAEYLENLQMLVPKEEYFVNPSLDNRAKSAGDVVENLSNYLVGNTHTDVKGSLWVVKANAGVGKTTLARQLIHNLAEKIQKYRTIPIYVEAQHWRNLNMSSLEILWDVIENSLQRISGLNIPMNEDIFKHALRQGYFCFIFDGFDELCGDEKSQFEPQSVLNELIGVTEESEARILLTTRTIFWDAKIADEPENVHTEKLQNFNTQEARSYFGKVFRQGVDDSKRDRSIQLYNEMVKDAQPRQHAGSIREEFCNLPLCLRMITDYVNQGEVSAYSVDSKKPVLYNLLVNICEREMVRQGLKTDAESQLLSFTDMAMNYEGTNPTFSLEDLALTPNGFDYKDVSQAEDHALLDAISTGAKSKFSFRYEFIASFLRAKGIYDWMNSSSSHPKDLPKPIATSLVEEADGKGQILEQLANYLEAEDIERILQRGQEIVKLRLRNYMESFFFHAALSLVDKVYPKHNKAERATLIFRNIKEDQGPDPEFRVRNWCFTGRIENLDLSNIEFHNCRFRDIRFHGCLSNSVTKFTNCHFEGHQYLGSQGDGWKYVTLYSPKFEFPANMPWEELLDNGPLLDRKVVAEHLLKLGVRKFWRNGAISRSITNANWTQGSLSQSSHAETLRKAMLKVDLIREIRISGVSEGGIAINPDSIGDVGNYMDNNQLSGKVLEAYNVVLSKL